MNEHQLLILLIKWLTYNGTVPLCHRELSFEFKNQMVQRYIVFNNETQMKNRMTNINNIPFKVDSGSIWSQVPTKDSSSKVKTQQRQLVFDIDMNDYDDVRTCCGGKEVCVLCWKLSVLAAEVIEAALLEDFGFQQIMYVFSGRRGMHIWVCDQKARKMKDSLRKSVVDYLQVVVGNSKSKQMLLQNTVEQLPKKKWFKISGTNKQAMKKQFSQNYFSPHICRSLGIIQKRFIEIFTEQKALIGEISQSRKIVENILQKRNPKLRKRIVQRWQTCSHDTMSMYNELVDQVSLYQTTSSDNDYPLQEIPKIRTYQRLSFIQEQIQLIFMYPRMDYQVSTSQNHLLKLPYSIHPASLKVSIPICRDKMNDFDPRSSITYTTLMKELEQLSNQKLLDGHDNVQIAKMTGLSESIRSLGVDNIYNHVINYNKDFLSQMDCCLGIQKRNKPPVYKIQAPKQSINIESKNKTESDKETILHLKKIRVVVEQQKVTYPPKGLQIDLEL